MHPNDWEGILPVTRDWWQENERLFQQKNYKAVRPGREPAVQQPVPSAGKIASRLSHGEPDGNASEPVAMASSRQPDAILTTIVYYTLGIASVLLVGFLVLSWKRHSK